MRRVLAGLPVIAVLALAGCTSLPPPVADVKQELAIADATISWQPAAGASTYVVQVSRVIDFNAPGAIVIERGGIPDTKFVLNPNEVGVRVSLYWRVAGEVNGSRGKWSDVRPFRISVPPPGAEDKIETNQPDVTLQWESVAGAVSYVLQVAKDQTFSNMSLLVKKEGLGDTKYRVEENFPFNSPVFWRVASMAPGDIQGEWSKVRTFRSTLPPPKPIEPTGVVYDTTNPIFQWQRPAFEGNQYQLELSTDPKWATIDRRYTTNIDTADRPQDRMACVDDKHPPLTYKTNYLWRMRTYRSNQYSAWSDVMSFRIDYYLPTTVSPGKGETVKSFNPRFTWNGSRYPDGYELEIRSIDGKAVGRALPLVKVMSWRKSQLLQDFTESYDLVGSNLQPETTYSWRVRSVYLRDRNGGSTDWERGQRSDWSTEATFRIPAEIADAFPTSLVEKTTNTHEVEPVVSPDGKLLAYTVGTELDAEQTIWLKRIVMEGGRPVFQEAKQQFTPTQPRVKTHHPCWLQDSTGLYYASNVYGQERGEYSILQKLIDRDQFTTVLQASSGQSLTEPHFNANTPKGPLLCYTTSAPDGSKSSVWTCTPTGLAKTQLTGGGGGRISPDGKKIVFNAVREDRWGIFTLGTDGGQITTIRSADNREVQYHEAVWSNDGLKIAYTSNASGNWDIYIYDIETGSQSQVTSSLGADIMPSWGPDDAYLIFASRREDNWDLWYTMVPKKR